MPEMFSPEWMQAYKEKWNAEPELKDALAKINFSSNIGYGFKGEDNPKGILVVENGEAVHAGAYEGQELNWDLRASKEDWQKWFDKGLNMMGLGSAYMQGKLKFLKGDYGAMIKDPRMAGPFIKTFSVMGSI
jgi:putative sterol carrier protein